MLKTTILKKIIVTVLVTVLTTGTGVGATSAVNNGDLNKVMDALNSIVNEVSVDDVKEAENEVASENKDGSTQIFNDISRQAASVDTTTNDEHVNNVAQEFDITIQETNSTTQKDDDTTQKDNDTTQKDDDTTQKDDDTTQKDDNTTQKDDDTAQKADDTTQKDDDIAQKDDDTTQKVNDTTQKAGDTAQKVNSNNAAEKSGEKANTNNAAPTSVAPSSNQDIVDRDNEKDRAAENNPYKRIYIGYPDKDSSWRSGTGKVETISDVRKNSGGSTPGTWDTSLAKQAFYLINSYRVSNGLSELSWSDSDAAVASVRAKEISSDFSHTSASGTKTNGGENIAITYLGTAPEVVSRWINSTEHNANILKESAVSAGVSVYYINNHYYWSYNFSKSTEAPKPNTEGTNTTWENVGGKEMQVTTDNDGNISIDGGAIKRDSEGWADGHFEILEIIDADVYRDGSLIIKTATVDAVTDTGISFVRFDIWVGERGTAPLGDNILKVTWNDINSGRTFQVKGNWDEVRWK